MFDAMEVLTPQQLLGELEGTRDALGSMVADRASEADLVDLLTELEKVKSAAAAAQAEAAASIAASRRERDGHTRGVASEVALARHESPHKGSRLLGLATALVREMPHTLAALRSGEINEWRATIMVRETAVLSREDRQAVDAELAGKLATMGDRKIASEARAIGYRLDPESALRRVRGAIDDRRVGIRPAPDTMTYLTGFLPVAQGVACWAALKIAADVAKASGDERSRGQIMADTLVARLTGSSAAQTPMDDSNNSFGIQLNLTMTDEALLGDSHEAAHLEDYGSIPAGLARDMVREADKVWVTRLFTRPGDDELISMEKRGRLFTGSLRRFLILRDQTCRTPWCDAPIRQIDHIRPHAEGGATSADNGQGLCARCNQTKESSGWRSERAPNHRHRVRVTTPTGHSYPEVRRDYRIDFSFNRVRLVA